MTRSLIVLYLLEAGLVLIVLPWTQFWDRNYFMGMNGPLEMTLTDPILRGVVSGVVVVSFAAGVFEIASILTQRRAERSAAPSNSILDRSAQPSS